MGFHHTWICLAQSLYLAFCRKLSVRFMCAGYLDDKCQHILRMSVWVVPLFGGVVFCCFITWGPIYPYIEDCPPKWKHLLEYFVLFQLPPVFVSFLSETFPKKCILCSLRNTKQYFWHKSHQILHVRTAERWATLHMQPHWFAVNFPVGIQYSAAKLHDYYTGSW